MTATTTATDKPCANPRRSIHAISAKAAGALIAIQLILTGCTSAPTPAPTLLATQTAVATPLPTETPTPTPTVKPTPFAQATPNASAGYVIAFSDRALTDNVLTTQREAYAALVAQNSGIASEARTMESRLKLICSNTCTTEGVLDQARWGIIARNSEGAPLVLQKTTDGGKTWVNVVDASAYSELVANSKFDKANYKLTQLQRPSGIPADATGEVVTQNNWMVYVWRDKTSGKILAWYDAAHDQYLTVEGKKLELTKTYAYKPLSEMTTWEQCVAKEQQLPWIDDPAFENAWKALIAGDKSMPIEDNSLGLQVLTLDMPSNNNSIFRITGPYEWNTSSLIQGGYGLVDTCGQLITPDGKKLNFVRVAIKMVPNNLRAEFGSSYIHLTFIVDPELLKKNWPEKNPNGVYMPDYQPIDVQFPLLKTAGYNNFIPFTKDQPISIEELTNKDTKNIATLIKQNQEKGIQEIWLRALQGKATKEELIFLQENAIIPVYYIIFSEN